MHIMAGDKNKDKDKKGGKPAQSKDNKGGAVKEKKPKAEKKAEAAPVEAPAPAPVAPRAPADPRLKVLKKFHGKFLPKGPLRERFKDLMTRWNSGEEHGGVTLEELQSLLNDWRATKVKPVKTTA